MAEPWLTIAMPVHRPGDWLDDALASVPPASGDSAIAVVIRDSTPEGSCCAIIDKHRKRLPIDYEYWPDIPSWTRKTNLAVEAAQTRHVCTLHQDDLWLGNRTAVIKSMIETHPDAALYLTGAQIIDRDGLVLGPWQPPFETGLQSADDYRDRLLVQNSIAMPSPVWDRAAYLACGGLNEELWYTPDWDLWLKLSHHGEVVFDPAATACFRLHGSSLTMTGDRAEMARELDQMLDRHTVSNTRFASLARASVRINSALADASSGSRPALTRALGALIGLGPVGAARYLHYSRLFERVWPRLRLRMKGSM